MLSHGKKKKIDLHTSNSLGDDENNVEAGFLHVLCISLIIWTCCCGVMFLFYHFAMQFFVDKFINH